MNLVLALVCRPVKSSSKRYDRDDRGRDYRMDERDYMNNRGRSNRDTYYSNSKPRSRGVYLGGPPVNKRMDGYGPPKSQFGSSSSHPDDKRSKPKEVTAVDQNSVDTKKAESVAAGKQRSYVFYFLQISITSLSDGILGFSPKC